MQTCRFQKCSCDGVGILLQHSFRAWTPFHCSVYRAAFTGLLNATFEVYEVIRIGVNALSGANGIFPHVKAQKGWNSKDSSWGVRARFLAQSLFNVGNQIGGVFQATGIAHQIGANSGSNQFLIVHLAMRRRSWVQAARARIGNMRGDLGNL